MSITDELRAYVGNFYLFRYKDVREKLDAIADRIDAEHEKAMSRAGELLADAEEVRDYNYANWQECKQKVLQGNITIDELSAEIERLKGELEEAKQRGNAAWQEGFDAGFASADDWLGQHEDAMAEHGWIRLPVDGEAPCKQLGEWIEKRGLVTGPLDANGELWHSGDMSDSNWGVIEGIAYENGRWLISGHDMSAPWIPANSIGHYQPPTVEDVLCELLDKVDDDRAGQAEIIAEYAAKLQLREGA